MKKKQEDYLRRKKTINSLAALEKNFGISFNNSEDYVEEQEEQFTTEDISTSNLRDGKYQKFEKAPRGQELLRRNLQTSPLYVHYEGDILRVKDITRLYSDDEGPGKAFICLSTRLQKFVIVYDIEEKF